MPGRSGSSGPGSLPWTIARRLLAAFIVFFVIVSLSFLLVEAAPFGTPAIVPHGPMNGLVDPCGVRATWASDQPAAIRYVVFVTNIFRGEWGASLIGSCQPVLGLVLQHAPDTLFLTFGALLVSGLLARSIGPALARRHGRPMDTVGSAVALGSAALPAAGLGLALLLALMATGPGFVPLGDHSPGYASTPILFQLADYLGHLLVPFLAVVAISLGFLVLAMRSASLYEQVRRGPRLVLESLVGGPAAPGEKRSAVPPLLPELAVYIGWTMSASLLVEIIFGLDGLGNQLVQSAGWDLFRTNGVFLFLSLLLVALLTAIGLIGTHEATVWLRPGIPISEERRSLPRFLQSFLVRRASLVGLALLVLLVGVTLAAPGLAGTYDPYASGGAPFQPPSPDHSLGTGAHGTDVLSAIVAGGAVPLLAAAAAFGLALAAGTGVAVSAGILGGRVNRAVNGLITVMLCLPWLPLVAVAGLARGPLSYLLVAVVSWPIPASILRRDLREFLESRGFSGSGSARTRADDGAPPPPFSIRGTVRYLASVGPLVGSSALVAASVSVLVLSGIGFLSAFMFSGDPFAVAGLPVWPGWQTSLAVNWLDGIRTGAWFSMLPFVLVLSAASLAFGILGFSLREASLPFPLSRPWPQENAAVSSRLPAPEDH